MSRVIWGLRDRRLEYSVSFIPSTHVKQLALQQAPTFHVQTFHAKNGEWSNILHLVYSYRQLRRLRLGWHLSDSQISGTLRIMD